ncbi:hypothetical protein FVE85_7103 [Porphyridium purpureum]|uniref:Uncharacterized protein n=1 Tax=Porphyridium purpureum TaxID=35688 RepID=A0A5J4Z8P4_PORPP|nr:hypothetical protein FVE85_7103 [Porphyridium purpureum]|eukprot:POR0381..scf295_1
MEAGPALRARVRGIATRRLVAAFAVATILPVLVVVSLRVNLPASAAVASLAASGSPVASASGSENTTQDVLEHNRDGILVRIPQDASKKPAVRALLEGPSG